MKTLPLTLAVLAITLTSLCDAAVMNVVLVHGAFADGSGWKPVAEILERDGYTVYVVQNPLTSFDADVAATRIVLDRAGPCVLVGHSWGGMIITEAGNYASVRSLVYVNAFQPDLGETAGALQKKTPPTATSIGPVGGGRGASGRRSGRGPSAERALRNISSANNTGVGSQPVPRQPCQRRAIAEVHFSMP